MNVLKRSELDDSMQCRPLGSLRHSSVEPMLARTILRSLRSTSVNGDR